MEMKDAPSLEHSLNGSEKDGPSCTHSLNTPERDVLPRIFSAKSSKGDTPSVSKCEPSLPPGKERAASIMLSRISPGSLPFSALKTAGILRSGMLTLSIDLKFSTENPCSIPVLPDAFPFCSLRKVSK